MNIIKRLKLFGSLFGLLFVVLIVITGCKIADGQSHKNGFVSIFDGKTLHGWEGDSNFWKVKNGILTGEETAATSPLLKANTFLIWGGGQPGDFDLKAEYRISGGGNSGIQYRSEKVDGLPFALKGYQFDIDGANQYTGQNYEERNRCIVAFRGQKVTLPPVTEPVKELAKRNVWSASIVTGSLGSPDSLKSLIHDGWNSLEIIAKGNHLQHYINGVLMCDITDNDIVNRKSSGLIGLQLHAGHIMKIEFRKIQIKKL